jgi:hypothetical protein
MSCTLDSIRLRGWIFAVEQIGCYQVYLDAVRCVCPWAAEIGIAESQGRDHRYLKLDVNSCASRKGRSVSASDRGDE